MLQERAIGIIIKSKFREHSNTVLGPGRHTELVWALWLDSEVDPNATAYVAAWDNTQKK